MSRDHGHVETGRAAEQLPWLGHETDGDTDLVEDDLSCSSSSSSSIAVGSPSTPPSWKQQHAQTWQSRSLYRFGLYALLLLLTVFSLAGHVLSFPPRTTQELGQEDAPLSDQSKGHHLDSGAQITSEPVVQLHDTIPPAPRLRRGSEYVLTPSWNYASGPVVRVYNWTIAHAELNPDGVYRPMMLINNQFPGPLVECNDGDTITVHVQNKAANATSIHFHGLFQNGTNHMDGAVGVTQCPIAPNSTFTYTFRVLGQSGTYWYHAHHSAQASDGLFGPVVIHSKDERTLQELEYATDRIIMVQDHYHNTTAELLTDYLQPDKENNEPVPDNPLINGRGMQRCRDFRGWRCDSSSNTSRSVIDLAAGQRHRMRFINVGAFAEFQIQIDEHPFYITEVDGTDVHPEPFHRLNILPAQRYSIIVEANATTQDAYWLRARMVSRCFTTRNKRLQSEIRAIVRYASPESKASTREPKSKDWPDVAEVVCRDLNTSALHPVQHAAPPPADDFVILRANFQIGAWALSRGFFNDSSWRPNVTHPSLHRFLDAGARLASPDAPVAVNDRVFERSRELVLQTKGIRTLDISINNFDDGAHPFHLHGHKFFVMAQGRSGYPPTAANLDQHMKEHGGWPDNPLRRDTVTVEPYAWAIVRVVLDNPGLWALHCHNRWHSESGMAMQVLARSEVVSTWRVDPQHRAMCGFRGVASGTRPDDDTWSGSF
ncbi:uncharacterized protein UV8b_02060 [Ustilaginoidea virens]|uniref:L-ascorbate oxidase n=1 Tax=Ustilaginoidea virens TaxID=1159556 RepID=A0A8E5HMQ8_USTVR|nr:uncharacterized protein UV8b_02060 [Ustilaginoidea virens]QUC17819.1 hypothetical protein UV8b_02060 [Ustilaginoidea virens]